MPSAKSFTGYYAGGFLADAAALEVTDTLLQVVYVLLCSFFEGSKCPFCLFQLFAQLLKLSLDSRLNPSQTGHCSRELVDLGVAGRVFLEVHAGLNGIGIGTGLEGPAETLALLEELGMVQRFRRDGEERFHGALGGLILVGSHNVE